MPALRFKTCRLLEGNVWNRELTIIQRRILRRLRNKTRSIKRMIYSRKNLNSYIQLQTTRKLPLFHGDLPITEMHRGTERTSYIPFPLNPETRSDVIPVRLHFSETLPQARQPISHRRLCVNHVIVSITSFQVSQGDFISLKENDAIIYSEIRRSFYIEISVSKIIGKFRDIPLRMWRRNKTEWFRLLKTKRGCRLLLKDPFLQQLRSSMQDKDLERTKKFGSEKVCLGSSFAEHKRIKRNFYHEKSILLSKRRNEKVCLGSSFAEHKRIKRNFSLFKLLLLSKRWNEKTLNLTTRSPIVYNSSFYSNLTSCSTHQSSMKRKIKSSSLSTHYSEVNHRTPKAVLSYGPNIGHIPHVRQEHIR
uniref:ribosomal protein S4 n=1 Tax=Saussurea inversa TaxID=2739505 RepID=UPI0021B621A9|nr:ribosomal protein S4 [Saussurea inversa]UVU21214.1 ribosomal protein S4 [Saussurea inversa]